MYNVVFGGTVERRTAWGAATPKRERATAREGGACRAVARESDCARKAGG